jgi:hypothetical protein
MMAAVLRLLLLLLRRALAVTHLAHRARIAALDRASAWLEFAPKVVASYKTAHDTYQAERAALARWLQPTD